MLVQIMEKLIEGVGGVVAPFHVVYSCKKEIIGIYELTERELVIKFHVLGCHEQTSWTFICFSNHKDVIFI